MGSALRKGAAAAAMLALTSTGLVAMGATEASAASSSASAVTCKLKKKKKVVCPTNQLRGPAGPQGPAGGSAGSAAGVRIDYKALADDPAKTINAAGAQLRLTCSGGNLAVKFVPIGDNNQVIGSQNDSNNGLEIPFDDDFDASNNDQVNLIDPLGGYFIGSGNVVTRDQGGRVSTIAYSYTFAASNVDCLFYGIAQSA